MRSEMDRGFLTPQSSRGPRSGSSEEGGDQELGTGAPIPWASEGAMGKRRDLNPGHAGSLPVSGDDKGDSARATADGCPWHPEVQDALIRRDRLSSS